MSREMKLVLTDDFDGSAADETVAFSIDGTNYEIELSSKNAKKMREVLAPYTDKARRVPAARTAPARRRAAGQGNKTTAKIRKWARSQGHNVSERGRVPYEIVEAYRQAHGS